MNAGPLLESIVIALAEARLEAVLIGNAAAALQGAPVTTVDFDFMFRATRSESHEIEKICAADGRHGFAALLSDVGALSGHER